MTTYPQDCNGYSGADQRRYRDEGAALFLRSQAERTPTSTYDVRVSDDLTVTVGTKDGRIVTMSTYGIGDVGARRKALDLVRLAIANASASDVDASLAQISRDAEALWLKG